MLEGLLILQHSLSFIIISLLLSATTQNSWARNSIKRVSFVHHHFSQCSGLCSNWIPMASNSLQTSIHLIAPSCVTAVKDWRIDQLNWQDERWCFVSNEWEILQDMVGSESFSCALTIQESIEEKFDTFTAKIFAKLSLSSHPSNTFVKCG